MRPCRRGTVTEQRKDNGYGRYRSVLSSLPVLVSTHAVNEEGTYTGVYTSLQVKSTGTPEELVGSSLSDVLNEETADRLLSCVKEAAETGERQYTEFPVYFGGEEFHRGAYISSLSEGADEVVIASFDRTRHYEREQVLYDVLGALVSHSSRRDLEQTFCESLVSRSWYGMAWVGGCNKEGDVEVRASAGDDGYIDDLIERFGTVEGSNEPGTRAAFSREPTGVFSVEGTDGWTEVAAEHGLQAGVALPLSHEGVNHGVLVVYTTDAEYLAPWRKEVLADYADAVGYALSAAMWRWALTAGTVAVVDVSFSNDSLSAVCSLADCGPFEAESVVPGPDETVYYLDTDEESSLREAAEATDGVRPYGGSGVQAVVVEGETPEQRIAKRGGRVREYQVTPDGTKMTVVVPDSEDVRRVVRRVRESYTDASVSVEWGEPDTTERDTKPESKLTDRQYEVLEAAYRHGYFEDSRECTLEDLADILGISRWTVSEHLRAAQRNLCSHMLE